MLAGTDAESRAAFDHHDREVRLAYSRVAHVLVIFLVPAGATLDHWIYPQLTGQFLAARLMVAGFTTAALALHRTQWARRNIRWFALLAALLVNATISAMVYRSEGALSPYYAGLNLVLAGIGVLLPITAPEAMAVCGLTIAFYLGACAAHGSMLANTALLYNNVYFLTLTSLISITAAHFQAKLRRAQFQLSSQLASSYQQVSQLERLKSEFFANVSHELRTPLTLIVAPLQDLERQRESLTPAMDELVRLARDNALRLLRMINHLLELGRIESEQFEPALEAIELGQFVSGQVESMRPLAALKQIMLRCEQPLVLMWARAEPALLEKILVNLLTNAIKFTPQFGRVSVAVRCDVECLHVDVSDTGIGICEADLARIFDRFRRASGGGQSAWGAGIGLALARELAERHGGSLDARSTPGSGSVFSLHLPRHPPGDALATEQGRAAASAAEDSLANIFRQADRSVALDLPPPAAEATGRIAARTRVLIVDDEPDMRRYLRSVLADQYEVSEAADGEHGLGLARARPPDIVLIDLMMPGMAGLELCRALKQFAPELVPRVMVVTARGDEMARVGALRNGADDFISKPLSSLELRARVGNLERNLQRERRLRADNATLLQALSNVRDGGAGAADRARLGS